MGKRVRLLCWPTSVSLHELDGAVLEEWHGRQDVLAGVRIEDLKPMPLLRARSHSCIPFVGSRLTYVTYVANHRAHIVVSRKEVHKSDQGTDDVVVLKLRRGVFASEESSPSDLGKQTSMSVSGVSSQCPASS